jgi:hypothetical protein
MSELRVRLTGEDAELGRVPAGDVARLLLGLERAVARAAAIVLGRRKPSGGRHEAAVEQASRLRLRGIESGSVVPVLEVPDEAIAEDGTLDLKATHLGETAVRLVLDATAQPNPPPDVAAALLDLADTLHIGERYDAVTIDWRRSAGNIVARIDSGVRERLRVYVEGAPSTVVEDSVVGTLVEADFENRTARLRSPAGAAVAVSFPEALDDKIQEALRDRATLQGDVAYDPESKVARSVKVHTLERGRQLLLGIEDDTFWRTRSFDELAAEQGAKQPVDPESLYAHGASDEEWQAFMAALASLDA